MAVVEKWNPAVKVRQDLFGFIDIVAIGPNVTLAIQTTSADHVSHRVEKIMAHENYPAVHAAGWKVIVHGWRKNAKGRWVLREVLMADPVTPPKENEPHDN